MEVIVAKDGKFVIVMGEKNPVVIGPFSSQEAAANYEAKIEDPRPRCVRRCVTSIQHKDAQRAQQKLRGAFRNGEPLLR